MPLTPAGVLDPQGPIQAAWFVGETADQVNARLQVWLTQAYSKAEIVNAPVADDAAMKWVEYRTYRYLCQKVAGATATGGTVTRVDIKDSVSYTLGESSSTSSGEVPSFCTQAGYALQGWRILTAPPAVFLPASTEWRLLP